MPNQGIICSVPPEALLGPNLEDMTDQEIMDTPLSRLTFLRLTAQGYNKMQNLLGPLITSTKALASRSCELASTNELEVDLSPRDPDFINFARRFIINLKRVDEIIPFRRAWVPSKHKLGGFVTALDGGKLAFGTSIHSIAVPPDNGTLDRSLVMCKSKIAKRNIPAHEALSGKLGSDALEQILQPLLFDFAMQPLAFYYFLDSSCTLAMLNPKLDLKNVLLANAVSAFKEKLIELSIQFPNSVTSIGFIEGGLNPSDAMTKLFPDPVAIINSSLYRHGPPKYNSFATLDEDIVVKVENGSFCFLGMPIKFMPEPKAAPSGKEESCNLCGQTEFCGLALTRARAERESREDAMDESLCRDLTKKVEMPHESILGNETKVEQKQRKELCNWLSKVNHSLAIHHGDNLIDPNYKIKCDFTINKKTYEKLLSHLFKLEQVFRTFAFMAERHRAKHMPRVSRILMSKKKHIMRC